MPRRSATPSTPRWTARMHPTVRGPHRVARWVAVLVLLAIVATFTVRLWTRETPAQLAARAEAATKAGNWSAALEDWSALNRTQQASAHSLLEEARACLALNRAAQAERVLIQAVEAGPADPAPWLLRLRLLHIENRTLEAQQVGWAAYAAVPSLARRDILRALTLVLLTDPPDNFARDQLDRWIAADAADLDAEVARFSRIANLPRSDDPDRKARIARLSALLARVPGNPSVREALVVALISAGDLNQGREVLDAWPVSARDARYDQLWGRWNLDYEHQPDVAARALRRALADQPYDWRTHYRLSRALSALGQTEEAHREAETVARLREVLEPDNLGRRLAADFDHLDDPKSRLDLASLSASVGLDRLAEAWRVEAAAHWPSAIDSFQQGLGSVPLLSPPR
jgi:hypothetical protein